MNKQQLIDKRKLFSKQKLIQFEEGMADSFENGDIKGPIHLAGTNEDELIRLFKKIKKTDWIFSTWRNHYHWLLSGRSIKDLTYQIFDSHSMHVYGDKFFTSAIVGGISPIAMGVAYSIKKKNLKEHVWCFVGDMAASGGLFHECEKYSQGHDLPITYVIEDNGLSVITDTKEVWGKGKKKKTIRYDYKRKWPHAGIGKFVLF